MDHFSPPSDRKEWTELLNGEHQFDKYTLQLMTDRLRRQLEQGSKSQEEAIDELRSFFQKYKNAFKPDLVAIFGEW